MSRKVLIIIILFSLSMGVNAQNTGYPRADGATNFQIWLDYNPRYMINEVATIYGDLGARTIFPNVWYRVVARPSFRYDITSFNKKSERFRTWQLHGGVGFFYTRNLDGRDVLEVRPFQGLRARIPNWDRFQLFHYIRLEERIEMDLNNKHNEFSMRARYMVGNDFYFPGKFLPKGFFLPLYVEFFFNLTQGAQFNDVIRLTPGLGYTPGKDWIFQFDLSYHQTRDAVLDGFKTNDIVLRLRIFQKF